MAWSNNLIRTKLSWTSEDRGVCEFNWAKFWLAFAVSDMWKSKQARRPSIIFSREEEIGPKDAVTEPVERIFSLPALLRCSTDFYKSLSKGELIGFLMSAESLAEPSDYSAL